MGNPDHDFIDLDWVAHLDSAAPAPDAPLFVLFHGLEGSSGSHYALAMMAAARAKGWHAVVPHFRSCSGEINRQPRFYHLADSAEVDWILRRLAAQHRGPLVAAGVSLGGNVPLRWLGEHRSDTSILRAAAAISTPIDARRRARAVARLLRWSTRAALKTLKRKAPAKLDQYPGLFDREAMLQAVTMRDFDEVVTALLHGFANADDYWTKATTRPLLPAIDVPTLILNARNDPFLPESALPQPADVSPAVESQPAAGGTRDYDRAVPRPPRLAVGAGVRLLPKFVDHG